MCKKEFNDSTLTISKAEKQHSQEIVDLLLAAWLYVYPNEQYQITETAIRKKFGEVDKKSLSISNFLDSIRNNSDITYLVAEIDGKIAGFLYSTKVTDNLYINALYVHPNRHRLGVGNALLREGIMLNQGIHHAAVDVISYNEQAIAFYRKHDFVIHGPSQTPFGQFPDGKTVPEIQMVKNFTDSDIINTFSI